ncbi:MAG: HEAT repeat domain-containing protein [Planctomycetaceae bacterium]
MRVAIAYAMGAFRDQASLLSSALFAKVASDEECVDVRLAAGYSLWMLAGEETATRRLFATALGSSDSSVQAVAALYLAKMGAFGRLLVTEILRALPHPDSVVRRDLAVALGNAGPEAIGATEALEHLLDDPEEVVRSVALSALSKIHEGHARPEWWRDK